MRETRVIIKVGKVLASIAAVTMLILGILILITAIQQAMAGAGKIAECGKISIYGKLCENTGRKALETKLFYNMSVSCIYD